MLLLFSTKIIPPPCAQGHSIGDTCHKDTKYYGGTSLEGQWLRLLPIQGYGFDPWLER